MDKKLVVNCKTGKTVISNFTAEDQAQRVSDIASGVELNSKTEREKKINAETRKMAIDSLVAKNEIEPE